MTALASTCKWESYQIESRDNFKNPPIKALNDLSHANKHTQARLIQETINFSPKNICTNSHTHSSTLTHSHTHRNKLTLGISLWWAIIRESENPAGGETILETTNKTNNKFKVQKGWNATKSTLSIHTHTHAHSLAHPCTLTLTHTCKLNREAATGRQHQAEQGGVGQAVLSLEVLPRGKTA